MKCCQGLHQSSVDLCCCFSLLSILEHSWLSVSSEKLMTSVSNLLLPEQPMSNVLTLKEVTCLNSCLFHQLPGCPQTLTPQVLPRFCLSHFFQPKLCSKLLSSAICLNSPRGNHPLLWITFYSHYLFEKSNTFKYHTVPKGMDCILLIF